MSGTPDSAQHRLDSFSKDKKELLKLLREQKTKRTQMIRRYPRAEDGVAVRLPASWAQHRLWFVDQLEEGGAGYSIPVALKLRGTLDQLLLHKSLDALIQRHEVLRTVFVSVDGDPMQEISAEGNFALKIVDLSGLEAVERNAQIRVHMLEEAHGRFDLRTGPLIRGRLLRTQPEEHVLLLTMHHVIADGWSKGVLIEELAQLYTAYWEGRDNPLEPLPIQYSDYAQWQRHWLHGDAFEKQLSYWRAQLDGAAPQLELPTDRPRPAIQSYGGANVDVVLDAQLSASLRSLAQRREMTLFMVLYAGWVILLSRLSGQEDVLSGMPVANRQRPELEGLIGFFVNTLVLRVTVPGDLSIQKLLAQVKEVTLGAYDRQDVPFEKIVEALQPERSLSRNPLFQVMFALQNAPRSEMQLPQLISTPMEAVDEPSVFDLFLSLEERGEEIVGTVNYATDLFDRASVERWMANWTVLLRGLVEKVQGRISDLPILPECERHQLLELFNATQVSYFRKKLVQELFEEQVERTPETVAVIHEGQQLTYSELNCKANQWARYLREKGVAPDRRVCICAERSVEMAVAVLAVLKAGGAYVPLDPHYPAERLHFMLKDSMPQLVLTQEKLLAILPAAPAEVIALDGKFDGIEAYGGENLPVVEVGGNDQNLVYVIYTSGSTGRPKGAAMPHRSMVNLIEWHRSTLPAREGQRVLQFAALSFDVAFQEIFSTLCTGATLVLLDEWTRRDARALTEFLSSHRIERLFVPPLMLQSLAEHFKSAKASPGNMQDVITAGEQLRISPEISTFFKSLGGCRLHNHYGPSESHVVTALTLSGDPDEWPTFPAIGRPISNAQIHVLDRQRQIVPIGVAGEIHIGGACVARGYLGQPELTGERFIANPFSTDTQECLYKTGDLGRWRADGTLEYLGRNDDQVKIRGYRIELGEIEAQLARHDHVKEVAVVAREDVPGEKRLVAYITCRDQSGAGMDELRAWMKSALPEYMVPGAFVILESLPRTPSGKLDRRSLLAPDAVACADKEYEAPEGRVEETVAQIWEDLLGAKRIGRQDNFFDLGGHSLLATRIISRIRELLQVELPLRAIFEAPTVMQLSSRVEAEEEGQLAQEARRVDNLVRDLGQQINEMHDDAVLQKIAQLERQLTRSGHVP